MQNINSSTELKNAIQQIEVDRAAQWQLVKEEFNETYESFRPANFLRSIINEAVRSPSALEDVAVKAVGLTAGYLSKKLIVGSSDDKLRTLIGDTVQSEVTNLIIQHPEAIKSFGHFLFRLIFRTKETKD